jgi:transitional endoplasmic reticulum ATPase
MDANSTSRPEATEVSASNLPSTTKQARQRGFDSLMLAIKLAPPADRLTLVRQLAEQTELTIDERRQVLLAIKRYVVSPNRGSSHDHRPLLEAVLALASRTELRLIALHIYQDVLEMLDREQVIPQLQEPLEQLVRALIPRAAQPGFMPELFMRAAGKLESLSEHEAVVNVCGLGLFFFPFHGALRERRADFYMELGNASHARRDFEQLIEQYPTRLEYRIDRAEASIQLDEFEEALIDLSHFLRYNPDDTVALRKQAESYFQIGRSIDALKVYSRLIELEPSISEHLLNRARVNEQLDFIDEAVADAGHALEIDKSNQEAKQLHHSLLLRRQSFGMEDDLYNAFLRGEEDVVMGDAKIPETRFSDIGGLHKVKQTLKESIEYPLKYPELSKQYGKRAGGGFLFFGPPGCGKTMLARAAAGECGVTFINVNLATVLDKWVGNSEKAVSMIFAAARKRTPSIIFLDEVDAIGGSRSSMQAGWEKKLISQLLIELDGLASDNENVMVLGASNAPWEVDFALRRPGRLGRLVFVPPPDEAARKEIFALYISKKPLIEPELDLDELARQTAQYSADAIREVVEAAASIPWREAIESGQARAINQADFLAAIQQTPADLAEWEKLVSRYDEFSKQSKQRTSIGFRKQAQQT